MKPTVIDASVAATWFIPEERRAATEQLYCDIRVDDTSFHAPGLWAWETANVLLVSLRRNRLTPAGFDAGIALLDACVVNLDSPPNAHRRAQILRLASVHGLTVYDAAYLELSLRLNGQLASLDKQLVAAAKSCGIPCLDL